MKYLIRLTNLMIVLGILSLNSTRAETVEILVNDSHAPYTYKESDEAKGIYIEIMKRISSRISGYDMVFNPVPWQRAKTEIQKGTAFSFVPPYYHGHDWPYVWPYSLAIMDESVVLVCRAEIMKSKRPNWPSDYLGLIIGNNTGYDGFGGTSFRQLVQKKKISLKEVKTTRQNILMLIRGRTDCYMANRLSLAWEMKKLRDLGQIDDLAESAITESLVISSDAVYMGFTDRDDGLFHFKRDFHEKFNNELYKMTKSNEIQEIAEKYLN
ncbi:MAG: polar amino acid transport system substrate-binding protein [Gammaproteobacteria bacterium]|jgi:polar amino acid transport system substrate-binding protein